MIRLLPLAAFFACSSLAWGQAMVPRDFAYGQETLPAPAGLRDAAAYRVQLPLSVYQNTVRDDLGDLRVFNAEGVVVPFSLSRPTAQASIHKADIEVPLFPLREGARISIDGVRLTINSAGSINFQTQSGTPANTTVRQYLLDTRALDESLSALRLTWPADAAEYTGRLTVEASDDLSAWHFLVAAPIANLHANGQTLIENRVEMHATKAKFWRLSWLGVAPNFELKAVLGEAAASTAEPDRNSLEVTGTADPNDRAYDFDLGAHPPVSRLNVLLPDPNSVLDLEISSRPTPGAPWRAVLHAGVYRLKTQDAEQQNAALTLATDSDRYWRARILGAGTPPQSPLRLHVEWVPNELTFLAQGHAPFLLAYGNATATRAEADLSQLPSSLVIALATLGPMQVTGGIGRLVAKPAPFPAVRAALWSVLIMAVLLLGWMAYRIVRDPKDTPRT